MEDPIERVGERGASKRQPRRDQLVEHDTERKQIDAMIDDVRAQLLRRHVGDRAEHHARRGDQQFRRRAQHGLRRLRHLHLRETEVEHLHQTALGLYEVAALDVAMDDVAAVRFVERIGNLRGDVDGFRNRHRAARDPVRQHFAFDVLHGDEEQVAMLDELVGDRDVRRSQHGGRARLAQQPGTAVGIALAIGVEELQRDLPAEPRVLGDVDLARAARPEPLVNVVVQDGLPGQRWLAPDPLRRDDRRGGSIVADRIATRLRSLDGIVGLRATVHSDVSRSFRFGRDCDRASG